MKTRQRIINSFCGEEGKRPWRTGFGLKHTVGYGVIGRAQIRQSEMFLQRANVGLRHIGDAFFDYKRQRDLPVAHANDDWNAVVPKQKVDLLAIVTSKEVRACQRSSVNAGFEQYAIREPRVHVEFRTTDGNA